jgi:methionyl-tRNA formyltransferase
MPPLQETTTIDWNFLVPKAEQKPVSVLFLGTSPFAVPSLERLAKDPRFRIDAVITQPDRPVGRKQVMTPPPVKVTAQQLRLPFFQPEDIGGEFPALHLPQSDFLVAISYGQILPQHVLDFPNVAPVNLHASLLPRFRGASPIQHTILAGDRETGVTVLQMTEKLDAGPILAQKHMEVLPRDTTPALHDRLATLGAELLAQTLLAPLQPRDQPAQGVTFCRKLSRRDGVVNPLTMTAEEIDRKVRALNPWPSVSFVDHGQTVKILASSLEPTATAAPFPCAGPSTLRLITVQPAGKKPMSGEEWERGRRMILAKNKK